MNRRKFLKNATSSVLLSGVFPAIIPASARGANGTVAPSNRITMASIGTGSQGTGDLGNMLNESRVQVVAACDVDKSRVDAAKVKIDGAYQNADCKTYNDFREMVARPDIDGVLIAVPDHWHALAMITAAQAGKDIYEEKPLCLTIPEGRAMVDAVERNGVVCQIGSQQRSSTEFQRVVELTRNGFLGTITRVQVGLPAGAGGNLTAPMAPQQVPEGFDYDRWLGPAPEAPYYKERCHWNWRWILDYSGGNLTDWVEHHLDIALWALDLSHSFPVAIKNASAHFASGPLYNTADRYAFEAHYANGAVIEVSNPDKTNGVKGGLRIEGTEGWAWVDRGNWEFSDPRLQTVAMPSDGFQIEDKNNHFTNFVDCVLSRRAPRCPIQEAYHVVTAAHLANLAFRTGRQELRFDPVTEKPIDAPDAERLMSRAYRAGWQLPV